MDPSLTRRKFGAGLLTVASIAVAGCTGDDDDDDGVTDDDDAGNETDDDDAGNETDDANGADDEEEDQQTLTILLENEDGESISTGVIVSIYNEDENRTWELSGPDIQEGAAETDLRGSIESATYEVSAEPQPPNDFEPVENEEVTVDEDGGEITLTLEGAQTDEELEEEDENGEDGGEEDDDGNGDDE